MLRILQYCPYRRGDDKTSCPDYEEIHSANLPIIIRPDLCTHGDIRCHKENPEELLQQNIPYPEIVAIIEKRLKK